MKNQMKKILKEINEKQKEIATLYKSLRKLLKNYGQKEIDKVQTKNVV